MKYSNLPGFAISKNKLEFNGFWDWFVVFNDPNALWKAQPSYICAQILFVIGFFITLYHALKNGVRFVQLWIGILLYGLVIESVSYNLSDIDNFWHSQSPIMFIGRRLPLHIVVLYPVLYYTATVAVDTWKLPKWSEPFAIGLITALIDYPYDVIGIRFMHWTWHDTDPNISDKHYHVPWNSFYFHITFAASFNFWFHFTRRIVFGKSDKWESNKSIVKEFTCSVISALLGMPGGVLLFIIIYHPLHDFYNIHSEVTFFLLLTICISIVWLSLPIKSQAVTKTTNKSTDFALLLYLSFYYAFFIGTVVIFDPVSEVSIGWHEPIGPCREKTPMYTALGNIVYKRKYLCPKNNDETYFGWSCLPHGKPPNNGAHWYTICGTPWTNKVEYIVILSTIAILGISFFAKAFGSDCRVKEKSWIDRKPINNKLKVKVN